MSVRHHEQLFSHQQREHQLLNALQEVTNGLELSVDLIRLKLGPLAVPTEINKIYSKYCNKNTQNYTMDEPN